MKLIKSILFLFLLTYCTHSFAKSNDYYRATLVHVLTQCNSDCKSEVFEQEIQRAMFSLMNAVINELKWKLNLREKELYD